MDQATRKVLELKGEMLLPRGQTTPVKVRYQEKGLGSLGAWAARVGSRRWGGVGAGR